MAKIVKAEFIAPDIKRFEVEAPLIARRQKPGQFVILRLWEKGERIPVTIVDSDPQQGTITLIVQGIGKTTKQMNLLEAGQEILDLVGPLGNPTPIHQYGLTVCVSGGVGTAEALPIARALKQAGNRVIAIVGARTKELVICESELRSFCDEVIIATDDGSYGVRGVVTVPLREVLARTPRPDFVLAVGPLPMMKAVAEETRPTGIKTMVSLNSIMIDGTGMCGGCRATVGGKTVFVCVDGPEFDAHQVNFDEIAQRQKQFFSAEQEALRRFQEQHTVLDAGCRLQDQVKQLEQDRD